jgi:hypothetical protein
MFWSKKNRTPRIKEHPGQKDLQDSSLISKPLPCKPKANQDHPLIPPDAGFVYYEGK